MTAHRIGDVGVTDAFGIRSRPLVVAMVLFACVYLLIVVHSGRSIDSVASWAGMIGAFLIFVAVGITILGSPGDPLPLRPTVGVAVGSVVAFTIGVVSLPDPPDHVMQTGPPTGCSVILLAFCAVRGRPLAAWLASGVITTVAAVWSASMGIGAGWGVSITLPGYAIMIMGSLFSIMLRPMTRQIHALHAANADRVAAESAAAAAADFRERKLAEFERRSRPTLTSIVDRHAFSRDEVREVRLLEAQLRDGVRAPGLDDPAVRDAAWSARGRGVLVVLLDDGALSDVAEPEVRELHDRLSRVVVEALDTATYGRLTARILPAGRNLLATITIDAIGQSERIEVGLDGAVLRGASPTGTAGAAG